MWLTGTLLTQHTSDLVLILSPGRKEIEGDREAENQPGLHTPAALKAPSPENSEAQSTISFKHTKMQVLSFPCGPKKKSKARKAQAACLISQEDSNKSKPRWRRLPNAHRNGCGISRWCTISQQPQENRNAGDCFFSVYSSAFHEVMFHYLQLYKHDCSSLWNISQYSSPAAKAKSFH